MDYNFDEVINRQNTACYKYDLRQKYFQTPDLLPMWVADMDFRTPDFILESIRKRLVHEILGYSFHTDAQYQSIMDWNLRRHQWKIQKEWIGFTPGVVPALNFAILSFTHPGDKIVIQTPVYFPFYSAVNDHKRQLIRNPLVLKNGRYMMDLYNLRSQIDNKTKMLILCNPHNPTGNVWTRNELMELATICIEKNILVVSDEIHADIVFTGHKHIPLATLDEEVAKQTITLMAPSKTFNTAGLSTSYFIASNQKLYEMMNATVSQLHLDMGNIIGNIALEAAYMKGENWLMQLIGYLHKNVVFTKDFINNHMPMLELIEPEATFLLWVDFRKTGLTDPAIRKMLVEEAQVGLSNGVLFGKEGEGFQRINIGCPRSILEKGLRQISFALKKVIQ